MPGSDRLTAVVAVGTGLMLAVLGVWIATSDAALAPYGWVLAGVAVAATAVNLALSRRRPPT